MKFLVFGAVAFFFAVTAASPASAQTLAPAPSAPSTTAQLQALTKRIEEQNAKIDTLSQQILKLEQQLTNARPGVMIGETTPVPVAAPAAPELPHAASANTHTVARGETLTSIAKMHNVTVSDLVKINHIENDRKLQIGQTVIIPGPSTPGASSSPND